MSITRRIAKGRTVEGVTHVLPCWRLCHWSELAAVSSSALKEACASGIHHDPPPRLIHTSTPTTHDFPNWNSLETTGHLALELHLTSPTLAYARYPTSDTEPISALKQAPPSNPLLGSKVSNRLISFSRHFERFNSGYPIATSAFTIAIILIFRPSCTYYHEPRLTATGISDNFLYGFLSARGAASCTYLFGFLSASCSVSGLTRPAHLLGFQRVERVFDSF